MNEENIFVIGGQVTGDSFIGRKKMITEFRNELIYGKNRRVYSLVGLARSGKTSFVKEIFNVNLPENTFYCYQDISLDTTYFSIWYNVLNALKDFLEFDYKSSDISSTDGISKLSEIIDEIINIDTEPQIDAGGLVWNRFSKNIQNLFKRLKQYKIKTILVFDEFDSALTIFKLGTCNFMLFRSIFSDSDFNVSSICISRRRMVTIEEKIYQSSTLSNVMISKPFKGFDDDDMCEYYNIFQERYGIELTKDLQSRIKYYAGNLPYLLSIIGSGIIRNHQSGKVINIDNIFNKECSTINEYYRSCIEQLEREDYLKKIIPFVIGPRYGVTKLDAQELESIGYLSKGNEEFISISEYFSTLLSAKLNTIPIWYEIINLEKRLKNLLIYKSDNIASILKINENDVNKAEHCILEACKFTLKEFNTLDSFIRNSNSTYFKVMSLKQTVRIIEKFWNNIFYKFFNKRAYDDFKPQLQKCYEARNPIAHGHEDEYLTDALKNEIDSYCKEITDILARTFPLETQIPDEKTQLCTNNNKHHNKK